MNVERKVRTMKAAVAALIVLLLLGVAPTVTQAQVSGTEQGVDEVAVVQVTATVMKVDQEKLKITLQFEGLAPQTACSGRESHAGLTARARRTTLRSRPA